MPLLFLLTQISLTVAAKELSVSDTDVSEVSWTDNGTFNLSEGYTPQTDTSDGKLMFLDSLTLIGIEYMQHYSNSVNH